MTDSTPIVPTQPSSTAGLSKSERVLKWVAIGSIVALLLLTGYLVYPVLLFLPVLLIMSGDSGGLLGPIFFLALASLPFLFLYGLVFFFRKGKYWLVIALCFLALGALVFYKGDDLKNRLLLSISHVGITVGDDVPPGILNLSDTALPGDYFLGQRGSTVKYDFSPTEHYIKEYYSKPGPGRDYDIIRLTYTDTDCGAFSFLDSARVATCKVGTCVVTETISPIFRTVNGEVKNLQSYRHVYQINDNGSCAEVSFYADETSLLSSEQRQAVVDSLERVPGTRVEQSFDEKVNQIMKRFRDRLENKKRFTQSGLYEKIEMVAPLVLTENNCASTLAIDTAPDGKSFVIHWPTCPNIEQSYCIENNQSEVSIVSTELVNTTYRCQ